MTIRDELAEFCFALRYEDLPRDVVEFTRLLLMDQIGLTAVAGTMNPEVEHLKIPELFREMGGVEESSLVTEGCKVPCLNAAFSNTAISFGGFDGFHRAALHLPCSLVPATVAVADREHASGKELILATVAGAEIMARVGLALGASQVYNRGFHPTSLCAPIGCAVAAGKLLGLGRDELAQAISIAAVQGAGAPPWPQFPKSPHSDRAQLGRAAQSGVLAALLAQIGVIGISAIFEDPRGFLRAHSEKPEPEKLTKGLGEAYEVTQTTLRRFGVGMYSIPGIEVLLDILHRHQVRGEDIERMTFRLPSAVVSLVGSPGYPSGDATGAASKSSRYVLAFTAYHGEEGISFTRAYKTEANLKDPRHIDLFKRIDVVAEPELDKFFPGTWPAILTVRTRDGREFSRTHNGAVKGSPENPFTAQEIEMKFTKVVAPRLPKQRCDQMLDILRRLEETNDVSCLAALMAATDGLSKGQEKYQER
ncbi:MAG: MmgE/PrpD family protein [Chloroflexi bacterium]|nr:MmgE/PrpD family protein [Chloroflexota bacterium]